MYKIISYGVQELTGKISFTLQYVLLYNVEAQAMIQVK